MSRKEILGAIVVAGLFIAAAVLANKYTDALRAWLDIGSLGIAVYILLGIIATIIAPVSTLPLLPVAVVLWGPLVAALASIAGWFVGALIAFWLSRRWGKPFVERFVSLEKVAQYERALGERHIFWNLLFLRMAVPVDILSYAVGLFTSVSWRIYALATLIGITPFAFLFAYASQASVLVQFGALGVVGIMVLLGYQKARRTR